MMAVIDPAALAAWVSRTCLAQGVPVHVSDSTVIDRVRALVGTGGPAAGPRRGLQRPAGPTAPTLG
jgi:hypothetical protein